MEWGGGGRPSKFVQKKRPKQDWRLPRPRWAAGEGRGETAEGGGDGGLLLRAL